MSRLKTLRRLARVLVPVVAVLFALISNAAHVVSGGPPYLSTIGPPSLRFAPDKDRGMFTPTYYCLADSQPKKPEIKPEIATAAPGTKPDTKVPPLALPAAAAIKPVEPAPEIAVFPPSTNGSMMTSSSPPTALPALTFTPAPDAGGDRPDNTIVTPEMVLDYLKPAPGGTGNAAQSAVVVPVKLGFVPPTPTTAPSSQAVYKKE